MHDIAHSDTFPGEIFTRTEPRPDDREPELIGIVLTGLCTAFLAALIAFLLGGGVWPILGSYALGGSVAMALVSVVHVARAKQL